jgi:hypothetical protein
MAYKKMTKWIRRLLYNNIYNLIGLSCGPIMINVKGEYLFIDGWGTKWLVKPTGYKDMPLTISKYSN